MIKTVNPDDTFTSISHEPLVQHHFDEEDNQLGSPPANTPSTFRYDGLDRLLSVREVNVVDGQVEEYEIRFVHDLLGNLTQVTDAQGNVKTMRYDALSRRVYMDDPDRGEVFYTYDNANNLIQTVDAKGQTIYQQYDTANRLIAEEWDLGDGTRETIFTYHYDGDLSPRHPDAQNTLERISYIEYPGGVDYFSYDANRNVTGRIRHYTENISPLSRSLRMTPWIGSRRSPFRMDIHLTIAITNRSYWLAFLILSTRLSTKPLPDATPSPMPTASQPTMPMISNNV